MRIPAAGTDICALFSCGAVGEGVWSCTAAGTARLEVPAAVEEPVPPRVASTARAPSNQGQQERQREARPFQEPWVPAL